MQTLIMRKTVISLQGSETKIPNFFLFSKLGTSAISKLYFQLICPSVSLRASLLFSSLLDILICIILQHLYRPIYTSFSFIYMEQAAARARQQKQSYICDNIDPNYYEEFHEFCMSYAGEIDIDTWPVVYVHQLVTKFKEDLKKKSQQEDNHQRSFAIYQTTSGEGPISGSATLEMNEILQSFEEPNIKVVEPKPSPTQYTTKQAVPSPSQNKQSQSAFSKKQPVTVPSPNSNNFKTASPSVPIKENEKKISALQLLNSAFEQVGTQEKSKIQQNAEKVNKSFFDSVNFWQVPKLDDQKVVKIEEKVEAYGQSPKKQFKTIKLNLNVGEIAANTNKSGSEKKKQQFETKNRTSQIETFNYNQGNNGDNFMKINSVNAIESPSDAKSQFDTFSMIAEQQIQKKRSSTLAVIPDHDGSNTRSKSSTIQLKQIKQLKKSPSSSKVSSTKQPYKGPRVFKSDFIDHVFCVKSSIRSNLAHDNLRIQIKDYQIIQRSIFSSNYLMYNMRVQPSGIVCKRNYEDFVKFKSTLQKFYPGIQLPYLEKQGWRSDTSEQYAKKQIQMLHYFMADILRNREIRNSRVTQQFLSLADHKKMKRKFQQYDRMTKLKSIEQLCLLDGKVEVVLTEQQRIYSENMSKFELKLENNIEKYRKNCQNLSHYYNQVMTTILAIDDIIKEMDRDVEEFNKSVSIKQVSTFQESLKKMRDHYKQNYFRVKFERNVIQENILPFLRYQKQNIHVSKNIIQVSNSMTARYLKRCESQNSSGGDSYLNAGLNQQKQGILQQSKNILVLKYQAGYLQTQASSEMQRIMNSLGSKIEVLWKNIGSKYLDQLAKSVNIWSQIA